MYLQSDERSTDNDDSTKNNDKNDEHQKVIVDFVAVVVFVFVHVNVSDDLNSKEGPSELT